MGNPAGVTRDFEALEQRRMLAADLLRKGLSEAEVARQVGVHRQSVNRWAKQLSEDGKRGLRKTGPAGRPSRLTEQDRTRIKRALAKGPEAFGWETGLWTTPRVAKLIEQQTGVEYHAAHVWKILRSLGWSCQRPVGKALERNEDAILQWKKERWPALKKKPKSRVAQSSSSTRAV